ncbi:MAG: iron-sulfur cluster insertion protein ErpA [Armatimonadetes bacterium]|nr:iron-sulfur cluster insertion protein ErpA [Armatimonadota bacterium]
MAINEKLAAAEITLTERAAEEIKDLLKEQGKPDAYLRSWVAGGGCSGLQYGMAIDDGEPEEDDKVFEHRGVRIIVDGMSLKYMTGSVVDFVDDALGGGFKIENPKAVKSCGCGSSFSTDEETIEGLDTSAGGGCGSCGSHG